MRELYVYTTRAYEKHGYLKVGMCERGRHLERIREQFGTSNPEHPIVVWLHDLPEDKTDHNVHHQLTSNGVRRAPDSVGREWFVASIPEVKKAFNQVCYGSSREESYQPLKEQLAAVQKAVKWFKHQYPNHVVDGAIHKDRFLLNAKMRFGKCFTGIHISKAMAAKRTLIVTYKPEVISEWMNVINNHVDFEGWLGVRGRRHEQNKLQVFVRGR